jgi:hypothetical protein
MEVRFTKKRGVLNDLKAENSQMVLTMSSRPPIPSEAMHSEFMNQTKSTIDKAAIQQKEIFGSNSL